MSRPLPGGECLQDLLLNLCLGIGALLDYDTFAIDEKDVGEKEVHRGPVQSCDRRKEWDIEHQNAEARRSLP